MVRQQPPQVKTLAADAVTSVKTIRGQILDRTPELRGAVTHAVGPRVSSLQTSAAPLIGTAATAVASTIKSGKVKATEARRTAARDLVPSLREKAGSVSQQAAARARNAETVLGGLSSQASQKLTGSSGALEERSRHAAEAAAQGGKDTGAIALWSAAAGGLIYYAFLDDEQRAKLKEASARVWHEAQEIYRDVQGYDGEFTEA